MSFLFVIAEKFEGEIIDHSSRLKKESFLPYGSFEIPHHSVIPCMKIGESMTYNPWEITGHGFVVIKIQDLLSKDGRRTNSIFAKILDSGGLHEYFDYNGNFIISSIAPDKVVYGHSNLKYQEIIESLNPEWYFTPDCETYCGDKHDIQNGEKEIERAIEETEYLINNLSSSPIGLVKGSNIEQAQNHAKSLKDLGINVFSFHTSEFLLKCNRYVLGLGIRMFSEVREIVPYLIAYGIGSRDSIKYFQEANWFVTQSHYTQAFKWNQYVNGKAVSIPSHEKVTKSLIMRNLSDICLTATSFGINQRTLSDWIDAQNMGIVNKKSIFDAPINYEFNMEVS